MSRAAKTLAGADRVVTHAAAEHADNPAVRTFGVLSEAADQPPLALLALGTIVAGAVGRHAGVTRAGIRMLLAHGIGVGIKTVIKRSVDRTRPAKAIETGTHRFDDGGTNEHDLNSFPSGHTVGAVAVAGAVSTDWPAARVPAMLIAGAVAAVQMPRGKHYIGDVLAGAAIGWVSQAAASAVLGAGEAACERKDQVCGN